MPSRFVRHGGWLIALSLLLGGCMDLAAHLPNDNSPTIPPAACLPGIEAVGNVIAYGCPGEAGRRLAWRSRRRCVGACARSHRRRIADHP